MTSRDWRAAEEAAAGATAKVLLERLPTEMAREIQSALGTLLAEKGARQP